MTVTRIESIPQVWNDNDAAFFTITTRLFSPQFTCGASALLASFDDPIDTSEHIVAVSSTADGQAADSGSCAPGCMPAFVPVSVRRTR